MTIKNVFLAAVILAFTLTSCKDNKKNQTDKDSTESTEEQQVEEQAEKETVYEAELSALNSDFIGTETTGKATFVVSGDEMKVTIDVKGAPANMEHWQHFHGFVNGDDATCATAENDENGDKVIDVTETEKASGTTMIPFNEIPTDIDLGDDTYPIADEEGNYHYETIIKVEDLNKAFADAFEGGDVNLDSRVLYIHGVPENTDFPETVESIGDIPAHVTLPIACGKIVKK